MRIAIDGRPISVYPGIGTYTSNLVKNLAELDKHNEYLIIKSESCKQRITHNANFKEKSVRAGLISVGSATSLAALLRREKIDIFHATSEIAPLWCPCHLVVTIHDVINLTSSLAFQHQSPWRACLLRKYFQIVGKRSIHTAKRIIAVSKYTKNDVHFCCPESRGKVKVIYEAVDDHFMPVRKPAKLEEIRKKYDLPNQFMFYIGSTKANKNLFGLLAGFAQLRKSDFNLAKDIYLVIAGFKQFHVDRLLHEIKRLGLSRRIIFLGYVDQGDLPAVYSLARLFVYPSLHEGFGLPLLEAMACDTPVVTSTLTSIPEVVGDAAILCDPRNIKNLAEAMRQGLSDNSLRAELIRKGKIRSTYFSWKKTAQKTLEVYRQVMNC